MRTVESVSRYYARQGYLGLIFSKVTNQLVKICKYHINDDLTHLWPKLFNEIQYGGLIDDIKENFHLDKRVCLKEYFIYYLSFKKRMLNVFVKYQKDQYQLKPILLMKVHFNV